MRELARVQDQLREPVELRESKATKLTAAATFVYNI